MQAREEVPVLVVGGSLVGLSTSLFLGRHGVEHLVVERHPGTAIHPRAAFVLSRTVELFRSVGIQDEVYAAAEREFVQDGAIISVDTLGGEENEWYYRHVNDGVEHLSPSPRIFVTQIGLEPVLKKRAAEFGGRLEYSSEVVSLDADADGVTAVIRHRDRGEERIVRAQYVVAADGVRSPIRERLGVPMLGHGSFSDSITIYFRADCTPFLGDRNLSVVYVFNPRMLGFFRFSIDGQAGFLVVNSAVDESGEMKASVWDDTSDERCIAWVREALGAPDDLPVEIEDVQRWNAAADWAERFREGRIFLAGDSAHVMPPTGGYGGNTGVQDAHNLAWKLAYALNGYAGAALLDTYDAERRPVSRLTVEQAYARYVLRLDKSLGTDDLMPIVDDALVDLGYRYRSVGILPEETDGGPDWDDPRESTGRPGVRAPHVELERDGIQISSIDLVERSFLLLAGPEGEPWTQAAASASAGLGVPVDTIRVGVDVADPGGRFLTAYGLEADGATLVRPDGFVAWRSRDAVDDPATALGEALAMALCRSAATAPL